MIEVSMKSLESALGPISEITIEPEITETHSKQEVVTMLEQKILGLSNQEFETIYKEALEEMPRFRPNIEDFRDNYPKEVLEEDLAEVDSLEKVFAASDTKVGVVVEYVLFKNIKRWFHGKIQPILPAEYDDYKRGIDLILEIPESVNKDGKYHAVSVDVVLGASERFIEKLMYIKKYNIDEGYAMEGPKYFKTDDGNVFSGVMVASVLGVAPFDFANLCKQELYQSDEAREKNMIPYVAVAQLLTQYKGFEEYAASVGKYEIADAYRQAYDDLSLASRDILADIVADPEFEKTIESSRSIKNLKTFFRLLKSGDY